MKYTVLGMMSGTSLDGLDMALCSFELIDNQWQFDLLAAETLPYSTEWNKQLAEAVKLTAVELLALHAAYGKYLGTCATSFLNAQSIKADFIASHGHTVYHQPERGITYQIGDGQTIANITQKTTICDFRKADVALGGQGAPLVPIGDQLLFHDYRFCLNLGGISNISFLQKKQRIAFDIGPANMLLNYLIRDLDIAYDEDGQMASKETIDEELLRALNADDYFRMPPPKSLGWEWFEAKAIPLAENFSLPLPTLLRTSVRHIAYQIAHSVLATDPPSGSKLLATGGGAKHSLLVEDLKLLLKDRVKVVVPPASLIDFKEAIVFGLLGVLRINGQVNCLKSVTGAKADSSGGIIFQPM